MANQISLCIMAPGFTRMADLCLLVRFYSRFPYRFRTYKSHKKYRIWFGNLLLLHVLRSVWFSFVFVGVAVAVDNDERWLWLSESDKGPKYHLYFITLLLQQSIWASISPGWWNEYALRIRTRKKGNFCAVEVAKVWPVDSPKEGWRQWLRVRLPASSRLNMKMKWRTLTVKKTERKLRKRNQWMWNEYHGCWFGHRIHIDSNLFRTH